MSIAASLLVDIGITGVQSVTGGLNKADDAVKTFGQRASSVLGTALVGAAAAGVAAVGGLAAASINAAAGFEQGLSNISAVSGATADEMGQIGDLALKLGKDTAFSASQAASGIEELIKGGVSIADVMGGAADATLNLAAAGGVSLAEAAEIGANALAMFNLKGEDMARVSDQVAGAANASSLSVSDFRMSLAAAGSVLAASSQSIESTATAIALMGQAGIKGSDAGTSLKAAFNNLIPTTDKATAMMKQLGIITADGANQFLNLDGSFKQTGQIAEVLQKSLAGLSDSQRSLALETMFGSDGMRAGIVLAKAGAEGFDEMAASMGKVTAASVGAMRLDNLRGDMEQLGGSLETAGITLGTVFLPALRDLAQGATAVVNKTIPLIEAYGPKFVSGLGTAAHVIGDNLVPAISAVSAATLAYAVRSLPALITSLNTAIPLLYAKGAALTASLGPFALVAGAAFLAGKAYNAWSDGIQATVDKQLASNEVMQHVIDLQNEIANSTNAQTPAVIKLNAEIDAQKEKYRELAIDLKKREQLAARGIRSEERTAGALAASRAALDEQGRALDESATKLQTLVQWQDTLAYTQGRAADGGSAYIGYLANAATVMADVGDAAAVTEKQIKDAQDALIKIGQEGGGALGAVVQATIDFQAQTEAAATKHWATLAQLHKDWAAATTADQRTAIQERIDAENSGYATAQQNAASAYATEQAANRAHLGVLLIDTVNAWQTLGKVPADMAESMRSGIAEHFGVAADEMGLRFGSLLGVIQGVADGTGLPLEQMGAGFTAVERAATASATNTASAQETMVANIQRAYNEGKISFQEYTEQLAKVPSEVSTKVTSNVPEQVTYWQQLGEKQGVISPVTAAQISSNVVDARERFVDFKLAQADIRADIPAHVTDNADEVRGRYLILSAKRAAIALEKPAVNVTTNADAVTGQLNGVSAAVRNIPSTKNVTITATIDPALQRHSPSPIEQVMMAIEEFASRTHTFNIDTAGLDKMKSILSIVNDLGGASVSLGKLSDYAGVTRDAVLRFANDLNGTVATLAVIVRDFDEKAVKAAATWAESAGKVIGIIGSGVDALTRLKDYTSGLTRDTVLQFGHDVYGVVSTLQVIVADFDRDGVKAAAEWSESAGKIVSIIGSAVTGLASLKDYQGIAPNLLDWFGADLRLLITKMVDVALNFEGEGVKAAGVFSESVGKIVAPIATAIDAFTKLRDYQGVMPWMFDMLGADIRLAVIKMVDLAANANTEGVEAAAVFGEAVGKVFDGLKRGVDALGALQDYKGIPQEKMDAFVGDMQRAFGIMLTMDVPAGEAIPMLLTNAGEIATALGGIGTSATSSAGEVVTAVASVNAALASIPRDITVHIHAEVDPVLERHSPSIIEQTLMSIHDLASSIPTANLRTSGGYDTPPPFSPYTPMGGSQSLPGGDYSTKSETTNHWNITIANPRNAQDVEIGLKRALQAAGLA